MSGAAGEMNRNIENRTIYTGDNLAILRGIDGECVDLIYLDPPFNSKRDYSAPVGSKAAGAFFKDTWTWDDVDMVWLGELAERNDKAAHVVRAAKAVHGRGMASYLLMMAVRLIECRRVLKDTGSIYLHCDPTAGAYLKMLMDAVFGAGNFRNEIVWGYPASPSATKRDFPRKHDTILRYASGNDFLFNADDVRVPYAASSNARTKYGANASTVMRGSDIKLNERGKIPPTVWTDIQQTYRYRSERTGYPTQKPLALIQRIIRASSNPGDMVLDPFCGCATTCVAAERLQRRWVGIDLSPKAVELVRRRLAQDDPFVDVRVEKKPPQRSQPGPHYRTRDHETYGLAEGNCFYCGKHVAWETKHIDHYVPRARGGGDEPENLRLSCRGCNLAKGSMDPAEFIATDAHARAHRGAELGLGRTVAR